MLFLYRGFTEHNRMLFVFSFFFCSPDTGGTKGERLSAKLKSLPGTSEPYESSSSKEIGKWTSYTFFTFMVLRERKNKKRGKKKLLEEHVKLDNWGNIFP